VRLASEWEGPVVFLATAEAREDAELVARIARHRLERPAGWRTVEEPLDLIGQLGLVPEEAFVLVDCLTFWAANALEAGWGEEEIERVAGDAATLAAARGSPTVVVSNEVGMGIVPTSPLGRSFRDVQGRVNAVFAAHADRACLVVAGRTLELT
jgi:adenosyl cobinamide kinase/adenosyl cobinamide phosphate guanylyltransferase